MKYLPEGFLDDVARFLERVGSAETCARCDEPLPENRGLAAPLDGNPGWATLAQLQVDGDGRLVVDGDAFCLSCSESMQVWLDGQDPVEPPTTPRG